jgi:hypothetical protein
MPKNITYLIGAGASALAIPPTAGMYSRMFAFYEYLLEARDQLKIQKADNNLQTILGDLIADVRWLYDKLSRESTPDTIAKHLNDTGHDDQVRTLKVVMSLFFVYVHGDRRFDPRYSNFIAALNRGPGTNLPPHINVVTWNYDSCFEFALMNARPGLDFKQSRTQLNSVTRFASKPETADRFSIFQLNGSATFFNSHLNNYRVIYREEGDAELVLVLIDCYRSTRMKGPDRFSPMLSFAWEDENCADGTPSVVDLACRTLAKTEILVIIGYSFQPFNHDIDTKLIDAIGSNLKAVWVQDKEPSPVVERINALSHINARTVDQVSTFYFPPGWK